MSILQLICVKTVTVLDLLQHLSDKINQTLLNEPIN
jgi:hypothetical protein